MTELPTSNWEVFRFPDFVRFFGARVVTGLAMQVHNVGVGWLVYDRTGSALALGLVGLAAFLPALLLALVAGVVADRFDRRLVVTVCWAIIAVGEVGLLYCAVTPDLPVWPIYAFTVLVGTCRAFANPATQALLPNLVPRSHFAAAVSFNASAWQGSSIVGPAIGGFLYAFGPAAVFGVSSACFALGSLLVSTVSIRGHGGGTREPPTLATLFAGVSFIRSRPVVLGAISLDLFAVLLGGAIALLPIYAKDILQIGPLGLGVLRSMPAAGAIAMTLVLAWFPLRRRVGRMMFGSVARLEGRAQDVAERSARVGRAELGHGFLLLGHFQRLDRHLHLAGLAVEHGDAGVELLAGGETLRTLVGAIAGELRCA
jgi:MFS family permease